MGWEGLLKGEGGPRSVFIPWYTLVHLRRSCFVSSFFLFSFGLPFLFGLYLTKFDLMCGARIGLVAPWGNAESIGALASVAQ